MRGAGGRFNQTREKVSSGSSSSRSEVIHEIKREGRDTTDKLIKQIRFNYEEGNYDKDLIDKLRDYLNDPLNSIAALIRIVFTPTDKDKEKELAVYIDSFSVYLLGVLIKDFLFEFGKYPKVEPTEPKEPKQSEKHNKKMMKMANFAKPVKHNKKEKPANPVKKRELQNSHLLGFGEGYGSGITHPSSVIFGREKLIRSIQQICDGYHTPIDGETNEVCFTWPYHLTLITVMVCEAARFHPISCYFSQLIKAGEEGLLHEWLCDIINLWSSMSKIHRKEQVSVSYGKDIPKDFDNLTREMVEKLCKDKAWVDLVLAVVCRAK